MKDKRNPFKLRSSESIDSDDMFVKLYSPNPLEVLDGIDPWSTPLFIQDPPGGGKTSLLHLFTPTALWNVATSKGATSLRKVLEHLGAIAHGKPQVIGVYLTCAKTYNAIEELDGESTRNQSLFHSLLNIRIILSILLHIASFKRLTYPDHLGQIEIAGPLALELSDQQSSRLDGEAVRAKASDFERGIAEMIDSFSPLRLGRLPFREPLSALKMLADSVVTIGGIPLEERLVIMLDDVQYLSSQQRTSLYSAVTLLRLSIPVWCAERLEALAPQELLHQGSQQGRDYAQVIGVSAKLRSRFPRLASDVATRRGMNSSTGDDLLNQGLGLDFTPDTVERLHEARTILERKLARHANYVHYFHALDDAEQSLFDEAILLRALLILASRDESRTQRSLFDVTEEEIDQRLKPAVMDAARLFLAHEHHIPYYFGFETVSTLASSNIQQFLWLSADLFEELISTKLIRTRQEGSVTLTPERQETILLATIRRQWESLVHSQGLEVRNFLRAMGEFCRETTYVPNASYAPGITGIGISELDRQRLLDPNELQRNPHLARLAQVISRAVANNFLYPAPEMRAKGRVTFVLYFNRAWCAHFRLPLGYGGWQEQSLTELIHWIERGEITGRRTRGRRGIR